MAQPWCYGYHHSFNVKQQQHHLVLHTEGLTWPSVTEATVECTSTRYVLSFYFSLLGVNRQYATQNNCHKEKWENHWTITTGWLWYKRSVRWKSWPFLLRQRRLVQHKADETDNVFVGSKDSGWVLSSQTQFKCVLMCMTGLLHDVVSSS